MKTKQARELSLKCSKSESELSHEQVVFSKHVVDEHGVLRELWLSSNGHDLKANARVRLLDRLLDEIDVPEAFGLEQERLERISHVHIVAQEPFEGVHFRAVETERGHIEVVNDVDGLAKFRHELVTDPDGPVVESLGNHMRHALHLVDVIHREIRSWIDAHTSVHVDVVPVGENSGLVARLEYLAQLVANDQRAGQVVDLDRWLVDESRIHLVSLELFRREYANAIALWRLGLS